MPNLARVLAIGSFIFLLMHTEIFIGLHTENLNYFLRSLSTSSQVGM